MDDPSDEEFEERLEDYKPPSGKYFGKILTAAADPDPTNLKDILNVASWVPPKDTRHEWFTDYLEDNGLAFGLPQFVIKSPLLQAIDHGRAENVRLLLKAGARPEGMNDAWMTQRMRDYQRFRQQDQWIWASTAVRGDVNSLKDCPPVGIDTRVEDLDARARDKSITVFWDDQRIQTLDPNHRDQILHSLARAAMIGSIEIFYLLLDGNTDVSFWLLPDPYSKLPNPMTPSSACISTPLHAAVRGDHTEMLQVLLDLGFNANVMPLAAGPLCQTPLQTCFSSFHPHMDAFRVLASHPKTDFNILTPVYRVHMLHLAVTHLDTSILEEIISKDVSLQSVQPTALGHSLLHIACLPSNHLDIQIFAQKVYISIHETRHALSHGEPSMILKPMDEPSLSPIQPTPNVDGPGFDQVSNGQEPFLGLPLERRQCLPYSSPYQTPMTDHSTQQTETVKWLIEQGITDLAAQDVHGNTALHYLAGNRLVNDELVAFLRRKTNEGNGIWLQAKNRYGWTPTELWLDNVTTVEELAGKPFWGRAYSVVDDPQQSV